MSSNEIAMVEELAILIKDNLSSKHLVLSTEETLVNFLQNDTSLDGVLELEPMNAYDRLLLHRLAEIFGFSHGSIGEGDERHLILERCPESSVPSVLVSDMLWQYDEYQILRRKGTSPALKTDSPPVLSSLEAREASYLAARERIFSKDYVGITESVKWKPKNTPIVARRMIAHALGQRIGTDSSSEKVITLAESKEHERPSTELGATRIYERNPNVGSKSSIQKIPLCKAVHGIPNMSNNAPLSGRNIQAKPCNSGSNSGSGVVCKEVLKQERLGAAKRLFANALGIQGAKENTCVPKIGPKAIGKE
ncbi:hypothetical protein GIB67_040330 [Kingdonia uniflora]|uniref:R3H domain-containing protein n=1 Tax=Kingdonia uniflora TaxID=39325 RepID=A0A7J7M6U3_9MAGN|nr:hypothetical protein GIB67_040330 [Kingdonia uniflora]